MSLPQFPEFKPLEISDKNEIEKFTSQFPPYSDFNFASLWSYNYGDNKICYLNNNLVISMPDYITNQPFCSFLGTNKVLETIDTIIYSSKVLRLIPEDSIIDNIKVISAKYSVSEDRNNFDYILSIDKMASLQEVGFRRQRNMVRKFNKTYPDAKLREIDMSDYQTQRQILDLTNLWGKNKNKSFDEIEHEEKATQNLLKISEKLNLKSIGVYDNTQMIAFKISEILSSGYAMGHFRKANINYSGIFQFIDHKMAQLLKDNGSKYFNYEQDLGIESLRKAKMSWQPVKFLKKYSLFA